MKICKHRVLDVCRKSGRPCTFSEECFDPEAGVHKTNADRIRAMSDKELAEFLCHFRSDDAATCSGCKAEPYCRLGHNGMIDWLQQPAEEVNEEND